MCTNQLSLFILFAVVCLVLPASRFWFFSPSCLLIFSCLLLFLSVSVACVALPLQSQHFGMSRTLKEGEVSMTVQPGCVHPCDFALCVPFAFVIMSQFLCLYLFLSVTSSSCCHLFNSLNSLCLFSRLFFSLSFFFLFVFCFAVICDGWRPK